MDKGGERERELGSMLILGGHLFPSWEVGAHHAWHLRCVAQLLDVMESHLKFSTKPLSRRNVFHMNFLILYAIPDDSKRSWTMSDLDVGPEGDSLWQPRNKKEQFLCMFTNQRCTIFLAVQSKTS